MNAFMIVRVLLAVAYPLLAHWATVGESPLLAVAALVDLALIVLLQPLAEARAWALALAAALVAALWTLRDSGLPELLLLAPPMVFTALLSWWFGRSLVQGRVPLISRIVAALEDCAPQQLEPGLARYTRRLTAAWSALLAVLAVANLVLALVAVPDGVLARLGQPPVLAVSQATWSWIANLLDYGIVGGFFVAEYLYRGRRFPAGQQGFIQFLRRMGGLGPGFWRTLFH